MTRDTDGAVAAPQHGRSVRIAAQITPQHTTYALLRDAARRVEDAGADMLFNWDHFHPLSGDPDGAHFECWTTLAAWAEQTERIQLGPLVSAVGYRNPDLLADMARTVDHISGGRLILGLGAGFKEREHLEYGYPFPPPGERLNQLSDALTRIRQRLNQLDPRPTAPIPLLVGAGGERKALRIVAEHANIWNTFAEGAAFSRKSRVLDQHCARVGRDPSQIERSALVGGDPDAIGTPLLAAGATLFIVLVNAPYDLATLRSWLIWRDRMTPR